MKIKKILKKYLDDNKLDGLFHSETECACCRDDLIPCGEYFGDCEAGLKINCDCRDADHGWHIVSVKE